MKKKFTRGGGVPLVLSIIALIISLAASFQEYLARFIYNLAPFENDVDKVFVSSVTGYFTLERDSVSVINLCTEKAFILTIISFMAFLVFVSSAKKKKIVAGEAWLIITSAAACLIEPVIYMTYFFSNNLQSGFSADLDGVKFRTFYGFLIYALPILTSLLLMIAGLVILCRLARESAVTIEQAKDAAETVQEFSQMPAAPFATVNDQLSQKFEQPAQPAVDTAPVMEEAAVINAESPAEETAPAEEAAEAPAETVETEAIIQTGETATFCPNCGNKLNANAKFCPNCGTKMN